MKIKQRKKLICQQQFFKVHRTYYRYIWVQRKELQKYAGKSDNIDNALLTIKVMRTIPNLGYGPVSVALLFKFSADTPTYYV